MKYSLTIQDASAAELAKLLAMLGGATQTAVSVAPMNISIPGTADDDETGDADAAPGTVDKTGLPWDDRIHSTPAKLTAKGVWRRKKNVDDATVSAVEAQLRSVGPAPVTQQQPAAPVYQPAPVQQPMTPGPVFDPATQTQPAQPVYHSPVQQIMQPAPQPQPAPAPAAPTGPAPGTVDFNGFMTHLQTLFPTGRSDANHLSTVAARIAQAFGQPVTAITDIAQNQQMVDYAVQVMIADGRW